MDTTDRSGSGSRASSTTARATATSGRGARGLEDVVKRLIELSGRHFGEVWYDDDVC